MSFASDVKALTTKDTGQKISGRTRIQGVQYVHTASADITFSNGDTATGTTLLQLTSSSAIGTDDVFIPDNGILFDSGMHLTNSNTAAITSITVFYVGGSET